MLALLPLLFALAVPSTAFAKSKKFIFSFFASGNYAFATGVDESNPTSISDGNPAFSWGGGFASERMISKVAAVEGNILFTSRMFHAQAAGNETRYRFHYIEVPLVIKVYFIPVSSIGVGIYGASGVGTIKIDPGIDVRFSESNFSRNDYGFVAQGEFLIPLSKSVRIFAQARYYYGIKDFDTMTDIERQWRNIQINAGFRFGGK